MGSQGRGWFGQPVRHSKASKGEKTPGRSWHGNSESHSKAAKGDVEKRRGFFDRLRGN